MDLPVEAASALSLEQRVALLGVKERERKAEFVARIAVERPTGAVVRAWLAPKRGLGLLRLLQAVERRLEAGALEGMSASERDRLLRLGHGRSGVAVLIFLLLATECSNRFVSADAPVESISVTAAEPRWVGSWLVEVEMAEGEDEDGVVQLQVSGDLAGEGDAEYRLTVVGDAPQDTGFELLIPEGETSGQAAGCALEGSRCAVRAILEARLTGGSSALIEGAVTASATVDVYESCANPPLESTVTITRDTGWVDTGAVQEDG